MDLSDGAVTLSTDGSFTYTPDPDFFGTDTFTYHVEAGGVSSNTATVTITVDPANDAPVATANSYSTAEDVQRVVAAPGVLGNNTDPDPGDLLTAAVVVGPAHGTVEPRRGRRVHLHPRGELQRFRQLHLSGQ